VLVVPFLNPGGAERAALEMATAAPRSHCSVVAEWRGGELAGDPLARDVVFASDAAGGRASRVVRLTRTLRPIRPHVVVSMLSPLVTAAAARALRVPVVHWLQAPWSQTTSVGAHGPVGAVQRRLLRLATAGTSLVAAAAPGLCDECERLGIPRGKLGLLPNGLRLPDVTRTDRARLPPTLVTVGRLEPQKRHDLTIRAVAMIAAERPVRLVVVGCGRDEAALRGLARRLGVDAFVEFTGFVQAPVEQLRRADVFVLASDHEGFGNAIVEALACGLPAVVSDVPYGPRFILDGGRYGTLVEPGSVDALARGIRQALDRGTYSAEEAAAARRRAAAFEIGRVAQRFEDVLDCAVRGGVPPVGWP
jgi:glycosyltransferase involved in cell wall biosynthesis